MLSRSLRLINLDRGIKEGRLDSTLWAGCLCYEWLHTGIFAPQNSSWTSSWARVCATKTISDLELVWASAYTGYPAETWMQDLTEGTVKLMKIQIPRILSVPRKGPWAWFLKGKVGLSKCLSIPLHWTPPFSVPGQKLKFIKPTGCPSQRHYFILSFGQCVGHFSWSSCWLNCQALLLIFPHSLLDPRSCKAHQLQTRINTLCRPNPFSPTWITV